jgi:hypothetical protein
MDILQSVSDHLLSLPTINRAAVSAEILKRTIIPVLELFIFLEEASEDIENSGFSSSKKISKSSLHLSEIEVDRLKV